MNIEETLKKHDEEIAERERIANLPDPMGGIPEEGVFIEEVDNKTVSEKVFDIYYDMQNKK